MKPWTDTMVRPLAMIRPPKTLILRTILMCTISALSLCGSQALAQDTASKAAIAQGQVQSYGPEYLSRSSRLRRAT